MLTVACVIPTHDRDDVLVRAIKSVLQQTRPVQEILICDDTGRGRLRPSFLEVADLDPRIRLLDSSTTPGAAGSRNRGARAATSDVLAFLDDDDYWQAEYVERSTKAMELASVAMVVCWGSLQQGDRLISNNWHMPMGVTSSQAANKNPGFTGSNFIISREAFENIGGFDESMVVLNDLDFLVRFLDSTTSYTTVEDDLVVQISEGVGHLSSRSNRRADGLDHYRKVHEFRLTAAGRRRLKRDASISRIAASNPPIIILRSLISIVVNSSGRDWWTAIKRRILRQARYT